MPCPRSTVPQSYTPRRTSALSLQVRAYAAKEGMNGSLERRSRFSFSEMAVLGLPSQASRDPQARLPQSRTSLTAHCDFSPRPERVRVSLHARNSSQAFVTALEHLLGRVKGREDAQRTGSLMGMPRVAEYLPLTYLVP